MAWAANRGANSPSNQIISALAAEECTSDRDCASNSTYRPYEFGFNCINVLNANVAGVLCISMLIRFAGEVPFRARIARPRMPRHLSIDFSFVHFIAQRAIPRMAAFTNSESPDLE